jgi:hypothetical protein
LREPHTFGGKPIQIWRLEIPLSVTTEVAIPEIVGGDQYHIGSSRRRLFAGAKRRDECARNRFRDQKAEHEPS